MHEWLSMVLLLPFVLHVWKNWRPLVNYTKRKAALSLMVVSLVAAIPFATLGVTATRGGGNPAFRAIPLLTQAPITDVAPLLKTTPDALATALAEQGYPVASPDQTLEQVASAAGVRATDVLFSVMPSR